MVCTKDYNDVAKGTSIETWAKTEFIEQTCNGNDETMHIYDRTYGNPREKLLKNGTKKNVNAILQYISCSVLKVNFFGRAV